MLLISRLLRSFTKHMFLGHELVVELCVFVKFFLQAGFLPQLPEQVDLCLQLVQFHEFFLVVKSYVDRQPARLLEKGNQIVLESEPIVLDQLFAMAISVLDCESVVHLYFGQVTLSKCESNTWILSWSHSIC